MRCLNIYKSVFAFLRQVRNVGNFVILVLKKGETLTVSVGFLVCTKRFPTTSNLNKKFHGFFMPFNLLLSTFYPFT